MANPKPGEMILYDYARPPLVAGQYRVHVKTDVTLDGGAAALDGKEAYFDVVGPRFSLAPSEVAGVFPPRNGHGAFHSALPHIALGRRTLPWERALGDAFTAAPGATPFPWLALVLFEEGEYELKRNVPLEEAVPPSVFTRLGRPQGIRCDTVEADTSLLRAILPMPEELQLLTHVRHVNVDDRELAAGDSDGYFAVVMSNRLPQSGAKHRVCLVSVEERTDVLPTSDTPGIVSGDLVAFGEGPVLAAALEREWSGRPSRLGGLHGGFGSVLVEGDPAGDTPQVRSSLVVLHTWAFECVGDGTFRELMQRLDVGMIGKVAEASRLAVTDTGHIQVSVTNRDGAAERAWYRGPLVGAPLSRDPNGPYHSADQARRVAADTGAEDVSYAAAFEVGRLLAAADARLAQELMRWRRGAYRQSARADSVAAIGQQMTLLQAIDLHLPLAALIAASAVARLARGARALGDPFRLAGIDRNPLLGPEAVREAFGLETIAQANVLLGRAPGVLNAPVTLAPAQLERLDTLEAVLRDAVGVDRLSEARARVLDNAAPARRTP